MNSRIAVFLIFLAPSVAWADLTGAGDAAVVKSILQATAVLREQLKTMNETIDVSKRLEDMERAKTVKKLHEEGKAWSEVYSETDKLIADIEKYKKDPLGTDDVESESDWLMEAIKEANGDPNAIRAYSSVLVDLKKLKFLGKAHKKSREKLESGINEEDAKIMEATNSTMMMELLISNEERQQRKAANNASVVEMMQQSGYGKLYGKEE